jgi:3-dehydroquinate synthase
MRTINQSFQLPYSYEVAFTNRAFAVENQALRRCLAKAGPGPHRVLTVVDSGVLAAFPDLPDQIAEYFSLHADLLKAVAPPLIVSGGEACKTDDREVRRFHKLVAQHGLCRHSFALLIGGGAVLDAMGFAAATAHRGIRVVRMPTTVLAQNDAGIGVKNAINSEGRKNFIGTFAPPFAVLNDFDFLSGLDPRDRRAGLAEAVKVALIKDPEFFEYLHANREPLSKFALEPTKQAIFRCAELHLNHIRTSGDPFELGSARPLDFGHWSAHKLEELSEGALRHGEAVAIGIAIDSLYSHQRGMLAESELNTIILTLQALGFNLRSSVLRYLEIDRALEEFREHLGSELCITLLAGIGRGVEVHEIDLDVMRKCVSLLLEGAGRPTPD